MNPAAPGDDDDEEISSEFFLIFTFLGWRSRRDKDMRLSVMEKNMNSCYFIYPFHRIFLLSVKIVPSKSVSAADR